MLTHEEAQRITLESGQEVPDIEITLRRSRTYKVSGVVTSAHGGGARLGRVHVSYSRDRHGWSGGMVNPDGTFVLTGLVPGQYEVFATTRFGMGDSDAIPEATSPVTIQVDGDVEGVTLVMRRAASVTGRVIIDSESPVATDGVRVQAMPPPSGGYRTLGPPSEASVNDDGSFTLKRMLGQLLLRAHAPGRLRLRSVTYKGVDVTDVPTEFADSTDPKDLQIVVTDRGAQITGRVTDEKGDPVKESEIILFAADQKRWAWWARTTERMMLDGTGTFSFKMLRPDRYLLVALGPQSLVPIGPGPNDAPMFEKLASVAMPVEVIENEVREITLTQAKLPR